MDKITIGIIGSGTMGAGIAQVVAAAGHTTILLDTNSIALDKAKAQIEKSCLNLFEKGKITKEKALELQERITFTDSFSSFKSCGLILEAVIEKLEIKQQLFSEISSIVHPDCILASNTSSLSITSIASTLDNPGRFVGIHFFNPATFLPLVEIIPAITTNDKTVQQCKSLVSSWGKIPVIAKDTPGFIVNRLARPFYGESIRIYEEGIANFATIDWAMKETGGFKMGPFELMDLIGNDVNYTVTESVWKQLFYDPRYKPSLTQKRLYEARHFGKKSGQGYYNYAPGSVMPEPTKDKVLAEKIFLRVISMLVNEAAEALYLNIATREDLDLAITKGVNYPKGLLKWGDEIGLEKILSVLQNLQQEYGDDRYRPSVLLKKMVKEGRKFY